MVGILLGYYFKDKKISNTFCLELVEYFKRFKFKQAALFCFLAFLGLCALYGIYCLLDSSVERAIYWVAVEKGWTDLIKEILYTSRESVEVIGKGVFGLFVVWTQLSWLIFIHLFDWKIVGKRIAFLGSSLCVWLAVFFIYLGYCKYESFLGRIVLVFLAYLIFFVAALFFYLNGIIIWKIGVIFKLAPLSFIY